MMSWLLKWVPKLGAVGKYLGGWQAYAIIAALSAAGGAWAAYKVTAWRYDAQYAASLEAALTAQQAALAASRQVEIKYIERQGAERVVYRDRIKRVVEYVKINNDVQCFDTDGLRLYREALAGQTARGPSGAVSGNVAVTGQR